MVGATEKTPTSRRTLKFDYNEFGNSSESAMSLSDTIFEFLGENRDGLLENFNNYGGGENEDVDDDDEKENARNVEDDQTFWEAQHQLLHDTLCKSSSLESRIRNASKEAIKEAQVAGNFCSCRRPVAGGCRSCLMTEICGSLRNAGFNSAICKSKWRSSPDIPSGEHTFLDVVEPSSSKKAETRVIIELNFRGEFEVARASEEYKHLIRKLPEVFVGKVQRLHNLIKILCSAAKKCMKENKMHMGPWRKHRYMQAKWLSTTYHRAAAQPLTEAGAEWSGRGAATAARPRASILTLDLLENLPNLHRAAVVVV